MAIYYDAIAIPQDIKPRKIAPGKKIVVLAICISISLFCSQLFSIIGTPRPPLVSLSHIYQERLMLNEIREKPSCFKNFLGVQPPPSKPNGSCHLINPPRGYCSVLQTLFAKTPERCTKSPTEFCTDVSGEILCKLPEECNENDVFIGAFDGTSMKTIWLQVSSENIQVTVQTLRNRPTFIGYIFIACNLLNGTGQSITDFEYSQLLTFPKENIHLNNSLIRSLPSLNFLMLDSVSRPHFYRSLPQTIKTLEILKSRKRTDVFDYAFMQAITQGTYANLEGLFTGYVNTTENPARELQLSKMLGDLKSKGYEIHWMEDICWKQRQGLATYFKSSSIDNTQLQQFENYINRSFIDGAPFSLLSCDILSLIGNNTQNYSPLCYNGKYFHDYLLDDASRIQERNHKSGTPTFTFTRLTTGRDYDATRIQTLDESLSEYLHNMASLDNTVTILFSNHGNTNGMLVETSFEGYIEAFNPFLFIVIPTKVQRQLRQSELKNLRGNEQNLLSLIDVHYFLIDLIGLNPLSVPADFKKQFVIEKGLISFLPQSRSCYDIPLVLPNLCICREFEANASPTKLHMILAHFCVGTLNNLILHQRFGLKTRGFGSCEMLMLAGIRVVHERRIAADTVRYKLDVDVYPTGSGHRGAKEIFFFTVQISDTVPAIRMLSYERLSAYEIYSSCGDIRVDLKLCVCTVPGIGVAHGSFLKSFYFIPESLSSLLIDKPTDGKVFMKRVSQFVRHELPMNGATIVELQYPKRKPCLYVFRQDYTAAGFCMYAYSVCFKIHKIILRINSNNYQLSIDKYSNHLLHYSEMKLLVCGISNTAVSRNLIYSIDIIPFG